MLNSPGDTNEYLAFTDSRQTREQERRRNAAARRKLETLREHQHLRRHLTEVWDENGAARRLERGSPPAR